MTIRPSAVAGTLYEADTQRLLVQVENWLESAPAPHLKTAQHSPKVLIAPHSGFHYSGETAAMTYQALNNVYDRIRRVILLGPSHRDVLDELVMPSVDSFETPLGKVPLDKTAVDWLRRQPGVITDDQIHQSEHSLEMQLPFLQTALEDFYLVPIIVGQCRPEQIASVLDALWLENETLIVVSTGLSRKLPDSEARAQDQITAESILNLTPTLTYRQACGYSALNGALKWAGQHQLSGQTLALTTSADKGGSQDSVRGFGSFVLS